MFTPSKEELAEATSGGRVPFKANTEYTFMISEVKETTDANNKPRVILGTKIVGGEFDGKEHAFFFDDARPKSKEIFYGLLGALFDEAQLTSGQVTPASLVSKQVSSTPKMTAKDGKEYANFYVFTEVSGVPAGLDAPATAPAQDMSNIPF